MSDFEDKVNQLLSSPEGMEQVMKMAKMLTGGGSSGTDSELSPADASDPSHTENSEETPPEGPASPAFAGGLSGLPDLGAIDPRIMQSVMRVMREYSNEDDRLKLLYALKPHLKSERMLRVDKAAQVLRLTKSIRAALDMFSGGSGLV